MYDVCENCLQPMKPGRCPGFKGNRPGGPRHIRMTGWEALIYEWGYGEGWFDKGKEDREIKDLVGDVE